MQKDQNVPLGRVLGAILLVAGCCIGAGMLGLPIVSAAAGFEPSLAMFIVGWLLMLCTGLLLLEVNLWFIEDVHIVSMAGRLLGPIGKAIAWGGFLFLFYVLNVAYVSGSSELLIDFVKQITGVSLPQWSGVVICTSILATLLYFETKAADHFNRIFMFGLIISYVALIVIGSPYVKAEYIAYHNWSLAPFMLPVMLVSFGFHNMVPSLVTYLNRNVRYLRATLIIGSAIPLVIYLVWEWLILGLVPLEGATGLKQSLNNGQMATHALQIATGNLWVATAAQAFAFFAIVTSFIAVSLSFVDFLADGLNVQKTARGKALLCGLVLVPPLAFALYNPQLFIAALGYAGGVGTVILFGLLPVAMAWVGRYKKRLDSPRLLPGGKLMLTAIVVCSLAVMALQILQQ